MLKVRARRRCARCWPGTCAGAPGIREWLTRCWQPVTAGGGVRLERKEKTLLLKEKQNRGSSLAGGGVRLERKEKTLLLKEKQNLGQTSPPLEERQNFRVVRISGNGYHGGRMRDCSLARGHSSTTSRCLVWCTRLWCAARTRMRVSEQFMWKPHANTMV